MAVNIPNVSIVGYPGCGKTVLLSVLCGQKHYTPGNKAALDFAENLKILKEGKWPAATDPETRASELVWSVFKQDCQRIVKTRDFAGEIWSDFIKKYGDINCISPGGNNCEIAKFLGDSAAIAVCVDLEDIFNETDNATNQKWVVHAVWNYLQASNASTSQMAIILTKFDKVEALVEQQGGIEKVVKDIFGEVLGATLKDRIFPVSAVQTEYDYAANKPIPVKNFSPSGLKKFEDWILTKIDKAIVKNYISNHWYYWGGCLLLLLVILLGIMIFKDRNTKYAVRSVKIEQLQCGDGDGSYEDIYLKINGETICDYQKDKQIFGLTGKNITTFSKSKPCILAVWDKDLVEDDFLFNIRLDGSKNSPLYGKNRNYRYTIEWEKCE